MRYRGASPPGPIGGKAVSIGRAGRSGLSGGVDRVERPVDSLLTGLLQRPWHSLPSVWLQGGISAALVTLLMSPWFFKTGEPAWQLEPLIPPAQRVTPETRQSGNSVTEGSQRRDPDRRHPSAVLIDGNLVIHLPVGYRLNLADADRIAKMVPEDFVLSASVIDGRGSQISISVVDDTELQRLAPDTAVTKDASLAPVSGSG